MKYTNEEKLALAWKELDELFSELSAETDRDESATMNAVAKAMRWIEQASPCMDACIAQMKAEGKWDGDQAADS